MDWVRQSEFVVGNCIVAIIAVVGGIVLDVVVAVVVVHLHTFGAVVVGNFCCFVDVMGNAE